MLTIAEMEQPIEDRGLEIGCGMSANVGGKHAIDAISAALCGVEAGM
jgi:hypothetical protein